MKARLFSSEREKTLAIVLLSAVIVSLLLRVPCAPLLSYGASAHLDAHARARIPAFAILTDVVYVAVLISLPVFFSLISSIAENMWLTVTACVHRLLPALRC